ncbi:MAG: hypothetical protein KJ915_02285 [Candidatus Omnitrophica bacterium]|nr:hypothetical protein [Candidatus Omnitrophota bacterium]
MKKKLIALMIINFIIFSAIVLANAQTEIIDPQVKISENKLESFKAGGTLINIPQPNAELVEVGYDVREMMEIFVPGSNRLLAGYMRASDIPLFVQGAEDFLLNQYASIQIARQGEYQDCKESDFKELVDYVQGSFEEDIDQIMKDSETEFNQKMKSMDLAKVNIDKPVQLGTLFSKPDAYSMGMISTYSNGTKSWTLIIATTFVRVRERLLFVYLFNTYNNEQDVSAVRATAEKWADAILAANK